MHRYFPQLRWRPAEIESLQLIPAQHLQSTTPIIILVDMDWDFENDCYKKTLAEHLQDFGEKLANAWPFDTPVYLDAGNLDITASIGAHPIDIAVASAAAYHKQVIPVYAPNYSQSYLQAVIRNSSNGVALKFSPSNFTQLSNVLENINFPEQLLDLIYDLGDIQRADLNLINTTTHSLDWFMAQINWRNTILSSTCYPNSQQGIPQGQVYTTPREEWNLWSAIIISGSLPRTPGYSDYPTANAVITSIDPRFMNQYVSVRYSDETSWIFVKGTAVKGNGWQQTLQLSQILAASTYFKGPQYSWGDEFIYQRSMNLINSGGSKEWRKVAHTHHLTLVSHQLIQFSSSYIARP